MQHRCALAGLGVVVLAALSGAQGRRISAPLPPAIAGDVSSPVVLSPDGSRVVFLADADQDGRVELYSAPLSGGSAVKLNGPLVAGGDVTSEVLVTADSARVVYRADQDTDEVFELYSVPIAGGAVTKISGTIGLDVDVAVGVRVSPNGRVVYRLVGVGRHHLYSAPSAGGAQPKRLDGGAAFEDVQAHFAISNDGLGVAYRSDGIVNARIDLWVTRIDGSIAPQLRSASAGSMDVLDFAFAPLDTHLVYRLSDGDSDLYSVPVVGGAPTKLNPTLPTDGSVSQFAVSADGARVVYRMQTEGQPNGLYSVPLGGGAVTELNPRDVSSFVVSPGSDTVVYLDDEDGNGKRDLHTVPIGGGTSAQFALPNTDVQPGFAITPDGARVIFRAINTLSSSAPRSLYSAPTGGGSVVRLNAVDLDNTSVSAFAVAPDSTSVLYVANQDSLAVLELWSAPVAGGGSTRLSADLTFDGDVQSVQIDPTGARAIYLADQDSNDATELYSVDVEGGPVTKLSPPLVTVGTQGAVIQFALRPDGAHAVYRADQDVDNVFEVWSVATAGGVPTRLNAALAPGGDVISFEVSPDWGSVVYHAGHDDYRLYSAPIGGGASVVLEVSPYSHLGDYDVSPDSTRVVYRSDADEANVFELFSVPVGGGARVQLNPALVAGGDVVFRQFRIAPDSSRVVYLADQDADEVFELWSVPLAGGAAVKLNGTLVANGDMDDFAISADSSRVLYSADEVTNNAFELFDVPLAGGPSVRLNSPLPRGRTVTDFLIAPDSKRAVYRADQDTNEVFELYGVTLSTGTITRLHAPLVPRTSTLSPGWLVTPDSLNVVVACDLVTDGDVQLYSLPFSGTGPRSLSGPLAGNDVEAFTVRGGRAVYIASQAASSVYELFVATFPRPARNVSLPAGQ
jgi:Tol biopolymer transport system component